MDFDDLVNFGWVSAPSEIECILAISWAESLDFKTVNNPKFEFLYNFQFWAKLSLIENNWLNKEGLSRLIEIR
jgi:hypothetical protein